MTILNPFASDGAIDRGEPGIAGHPLGNRLAGDETGEQERERGAGRGAEHDVDDPLPEPEDRAGGQRQHGSGDERHRGGDVAQHEDDRPERPETVDPFDEPVEENAELPAQRDQRDDGDDAHEDASEGQALRGCGFVAHRCRIVPPRQVGENPVRRDGRARGARPMAPSPPGVQRPAGSHAAIV